MLVVDASLIAAAFAEETHTEFARDMVGRFTATGFLSPALIRWELSSVFWKKARQGEIDEEDLDDLARFIDALDVLHPDAPDGPAVARLVRMAEAHGVSAYDGAYLSLAVDLDLPLGTADRRLTKAAVAAGLVVHSPFA